MSIVLLFRIFGAAIQRNMYMYWAIRPPICVPNIAGKIAPKLHRTNRWVVLLFVFDLNIHRMINIPHRKRRWKFPPPKLDATLRYMAYLPIKGILDKNEPPPINIMVENIRANIRYLGFSLYM